MSSPFIPGLPGGTFPDNFLPDAGNPTPPPVPPPVGGPTPDPRSGAIFVFPRWQSPVAVNGRSTGTSAAVARSDGKIVVHI